jgi:hypothetical protein
MWTQALGEEIEADVPGRIAWTPEPERHAEQPRHEEEAEHEEQSRRAAIPGLERTRADSPKSHFVAATAAAIISRPAALARQVSSTRRSSSTATARATRPGAVGRAELDGG